MTVLVASADATSATFQYTLADSDSLLVQQGITLVHSAQGTIIRASTGGHVDVQGKLFGRIRFGGISGIGTGNSVAIGATGAIFGGNDAAVTTTSDASAVHNQGQLSGRVGILMGSEIPGNQNAQVSNDGFILGTEAGIISFSGNNASVNNAGTIRVDRAAFSSFQADPLGDLVGGIMLLGDNAAIVNTGDILVGAANAYGIAVAGQGTMIENAGLIQTSNATSLRGAVTLFAPVAGITTFTNLTQGSVVSGVTAVLGGDGNDRIINLGLLSGDVVLAGGDGQGRQCGGYPWRCAVGGGERYL